MVENNGFLFSHSRSWYDQMCSLGTHKGGRKGQTNTFALSREIAFWSGWDISRVPGTQALTGLAPLVVQAIKFASMTKKSCKSGLTWNGPSDHQSTAELSLTLCYRAFLTLRGHTHILYKPIIYRYRYKLYITTNRVYINKLTTYYFSINKSYGLICVDLLWVPLHGDDLLRLVSKDNSGCQTTVFWHSPIF